MFDQTNYYLYDYTSNILPKIIGIKCGKKTSSRISKSKILSIDHA